MDRSAITNTLRLAVALAALSVCSTTVVVGKESAVKIEMTGLQAQATSIALAEFAKRGYDLKHFAVTLEVNGKKHQVTFIPEHPPGAPATRGGRTAFGEEVSYLISEQGAIEKVSYAR
jgi:hypothetical protein